MPNYKRANTKGGTYFFTVVTYRRQKILCNENVRDALRTGIRTVQSRNPFTIDAWVLLPDHLHCIWTLPPDDAEFGKRWAMIKRYVTRQCGPQPGRMRIYAHQRFTSRFQWVFFLWIGMWWGN